MIETISLTDTDDTDIEMADDGIEEAFAAFENIGTRQWQYVRYFSNGNMFGFFLFFSDSDTSEDLLPISEIKKQLLMKKMGKGLGGKVAQNDVSVISVQQRTAGVEDVNDGDIAIGV